MILINWLTITTTLIAAIAPSVISFFTIIYQVKINRDNNKQQLELNKQSHDYQLKQKQLEIYNTIKTTVINDYLDNLNNYIFNPTDKNFINYQIAMSKTCMYTSKKNYETISIIDSLIKAKQFDTIKNSYLACLFNDLNIEAHQYNQNY